MRCPYCETSNDEAAELCRQCGRELPQDKKPWLGPSNSSEVSAPKDVLLANQEWDPARRSSESRPMSRFVPPARFPDHMGWAITILILCLPPTGVVAYLLSVQAQFPHRWGWVASALVLCCMPVGILALLCSLQVRRKHALGDDSRAFRYSRLAEVACWVSFVMGVALYVTVFVVILYGVNRYRLSMPF